jgi:hypothetical protein
VNGCDEVYCRLFHQFPILAKRREVELVTVDTGERRL